MWFEFQSCTTLSPRIKLLCLTPIKQQTSLWCMAKSLDFDFWVTSWTIFVLGVLEFFSTINAWNSHFIECLIFSIIMKQNFCNEISILWQLTWPTTKYYFANLIFFVHADMNLECSCKIELTTANKTCIFASNSFDLLNLLDNTRKKYSFEPKTRNVQTNKLFRLSLNSFKV